MDQRLPIDIDTQEQQPWHFYDMARCYRVSLPTGDYALHGDLGFAVERKSLSDFLSTLLSGWPRFLREIDRMKAMQFPALVVIVEADWRDVIERAEELTGKEPPLFLRRVAELTMRGVAVIFAGGPVEAAGLCWRILMERAKQLEEMEGDGR